MHDADVESGAEVEDCHVIVREAKQIGKPRQCSTTERGKLKSSVCLCLANE